eukprot:9091343-Pyramimonas_sp.AAC.2
MPSPLQPTCFHAGTGGRAVLVLLDNESRANRKWGASIFPGQDPIAAARRLAAVEYNVTKKTEHVFKSMRHDGDHISAVAPDLYAERMKAFLREVFY